MPQRTLNSGGHQQVTGSPRFYLALFRRYLEINLVNCMTSRGSFYVPLKKQTPFRPVVLLEVVLHSIERWGRIQLIPYISSHSQHCQVMINLHLEGG
jgi:hypothetical protein